MGLEKASSKEICKERKCRLKKFGVRMGFRVHVEKRHDSYHKSQLLCNGLWLVFHFSGNNSELQN